MSFLVKRVDFREYTALAKTKAVSYTQNGWQCPPLGGPDPLHEASMLGMETGYRIGFLEALAWMIENNYARNLKR